MKILLAAGIAFSSFSLLAQSDGDFHLDLEYKMDASGVIRLNSSDAKVFIVGSNRTTAHVKIDREVTAKGWMFGEEKFTVDVTETNGDLSIKEKSGGTHVGIVGYYNESYTINIEAPAGASLMIRGDDGDYFIKEINGSIELDLDDADVMIRNASFQKIVADIDDGDFLVETALSDNGDYYINAQDGLVSMTVLSGGGKFDIRHDDGRITAKGEFEMGEKSEDRTRLTLANGNARINIHADDARIRLTR